MKKIKLSEYAMIRLEDKKYIYWAEIYEWYDSECSETYQKIANENNCEFFFDAEEGYFKVYSEGYNLNELIEKIKSVVKKMKMECGE